MGTHHNSVLEPVPVEARSQIQQLLAEILGSAPFRTSRQCQDLFRFIVEHSLAGSEDSLRERVIGIEVFGRAPNYDTADDPVVRLRAADVRKRLAQYYQSRIGEVGNWKIEIPTGSYKAQFHPTEAILSPVPLPPVVDQHTETIHPSSTETLVANLQPKPKRLWIFASLAGCLGLVLTLFLLQHTTSKAASSFDLFWGPVLENSRPVLVCTGSNPVYLLSQQALEKYRTIHSREQDAHRNFETLVPADELKRFAGNDFFPVKDVYLTIGDASTTAQISSLLTSRHHAFDLRFGSDLSFGDLRQGSAILIGAFNNSWTLNMTDNLRFVFESGDTPQMHIQDRLDGSQSWRPKGPPGKVSEDYAVISRILDPRTDSVLVTIAGLNHSGTQAAGEFATNPQLIADFVKHAPKDWNKKNFQIVLHTNVVNNIPSSPTVVATHYW